MEKQILTKEQAIKGHRDMWNWIAEQKENRNSKSVSSLKHEWCKEHNDSLVSDCYCCEYAVQKALSEHITETDETCTKDNIIGNYNYNYCEHCPLIWGTENHVKCFCCENGVKDVALRYGSRLYTGLWLMAHNCKDNKECAEICRKIANLEVKQDV